MTQPLYKPRIDFDNSPRHYRQYTYLDRGDEKPGLQDITYPVIGAMLETYVDALHVSLLLEEPAFLRKLAESRPHEHILNPVFIRPRLVQPPRYVTEALGNYLEAPSFFVKHQIGRPGEPPHQDHHQAPATQFAQDLHAQLRRRAIEYSKLFKVHFYPPQGKGGDLPDEEWRALKRAKPSKALKEFEDAVKNYGRVVESFSKQYRAEHFPPDTSSSRPPILTPAQKKEVFEAFEQSRELAEFDQGFRPLIDAVKEALSPPALERIFIEYGDQYYTLPNTRLNPKFASSTPALMLWVMQAIGRHQIDRLFFPKQGFDFLLDVIGVESNVTDNAALLQRRMEEVMRRQGHTPNDDMLYPAAAKAELVEMLSSYKRGLQLLHAFHTTAGQLEKIYPPDKKDIAYHDMENLLGLVGETPRLEQLETPKEVATMLFAIERRLSIHPKVDRAVAAIGSNLRELANNVAVYKDFAKVKPSIKERILTQLARLKAYSDIATEELATLTPAMDLIEKSLEHVPARSGEISHEERSQEPPQAGRGAGG